MFLLSIGKPSTGKTVCCKLLFAPYEKSEIFIEQFELGKLKVKPVRRSRTEKVEEVQPVADYSIKTCHPIDQWLDETMSKNGGGYVVVTDEGGLLGKTGSKTSLEVGTKIAYNGKYSGMNIAASTLKRGKAYSGSVQLIMNVLGQWETLRESFYGKDSKESGFSARFLTFYSNHNIYKPYTLGEIQKNVDDNNLLASLSSYYKGAVPLLILGAFRKNKSEHKLLSFNKKQRAIIKETIRKARGDFSLKVLTLTSAICKWQKSKKI